MLFQTCLTFIFTEHEENVLNQSMLFSMQLQWMSLFEVFNSRKKPLSEEETKM